MTRLPTVCVIGAGSSGIAAAKTLHERGIDVDVLREGRPRRRQLGVRELQRDVVRLQAPAHQHVARAHGVLGLPDAEALPRLPAPHARSPSTSTTTSSTSASATGSASGPASSTPSADRERVGGHDRGGGDEALRLARRRQRPPLGSALARARLPGPGHVRRRADARPPLRRRRPLHGQARARRRHRQLGDGHRHRGRATSRPTRALLAPRRLRAPQVPLRPAARPDRRQRVHRRGAVAGAAARSSRRCTASASARSRTTACRSPTTGSARRTRRSRPTS